MFTVYYIFLTYMLYLKIKNNYFSLCPIILLLPIHFIILFYHVFVLIYNLRDFNIFFILLFGQSNVL